MHFRDDSVRLIIMNHPDFLVCGLILCAQLVETRGGVVDEGCEHVGLGQALFLLQPKGVKLHPTDMVAVGLWMSLQDSWVETSGEIFLSCLDRAERWVGADG